MTNTTEKNKISLVRKAVSLAGDKESGKNQVILKRCPASAPMEQFRVIA